MRIFLLVLDSFGIGEAPDCKKYGDEGSNTYKSVTSNKFCKIPTLTKLGLTNIDGLAPKTDKFISKIVRLEELSNGKDSTTGHWEMAGIITKTPFPTYPNGFSADIINKLKKAWGVKNILCNKPYSGTQVLVDYGKEHIKTHSPIVYTSADSVLQVACHEDIFPVPRLHEMCEQAREIMSGKDAVSRIIARPFVGDYPNFTRTENRKDFSIDPPKNHLFELVKNAGKDTISIGKINDLFNNQSINKMYPNNGNDGEIQSLFDAQKQDFDGLCWLNFCDFDSKYGHRNDCDGYAKALTVVDKAVAKFLKKMRDDDLLIITADHGCDPATASTDHSREYVPCILYKKDIIPENLGTKKGFNHIGATVLKSLNIDTKIETLSSKNSLL